MQELSLSVLQRIKKTKQVIQISIPSESMKQLRQQQKIRCEKQNFIISMMRSNKFTSPNQKKAYYKTSYVLMKQIQPKFIYQVADPSDQNFLNSFVQLYTSFFHHFEDKFTFKTKVKNLLRPTNHNLIMDLVKYFVDFTRDYYVQTLFWKIKNLNKIETQIFEEEFITRTATQYQPQLYSKANKDNKEHSFKNLSITNDFPCFSSQTSIKKISDDNQQRKHIQKTYDVLQIMAMPQLFTSIKETSVQNIKMKINQVYRQQKNRNSSIRQISQSYLQKYYQKFNKKPKQSANLYVESFDRKDSINIISLPLKFSINIQKNGFSIINVQYESKRNKNGYFNTNNIKFQSFSNISSNINSPSKKTQIISCMKKIQNSPLKKIQNSFSPIKLNQKANSCQQSVKGDYFLSSMRILRVSQNFLPPLIASNLNGFNCSNVLNSSKKQLKDVGQKKSLPFSLKLQKMSEQIEEAVPYNQGNMNILVKSNSYKKSTKSKNRIQSYNNQIYNGQYFHVRQSSQSKARPNQIEIAAFRACSNKIKFKSKGGEDLKMYEIGNYVSNNTHGRLKIHKKHDSQQKILEWLDKIKNLKQIERRKILGL